ncbi:Hypothetical protein NTJ_02627 [Nesidiocoris tenuis]|uniref:Uncharacterized protein n=1 Tax=Nesidiocoris tenuis TaxID=355587 RepID=A0ABN7AG49_9HEMI|nr:Hypothetical protein NTJ_02627 [Nesidiocoris tenuis]
MDFTKMMQSSIERKKFMVSFQLPYKQPRGTSLLEDFNKLQLMVVSCHWNEPRRPGNSGRLMQNTMEKPQGSFCPRPGQAHHGARGRQDGTRVESGPEPRVLAAHRDSQRDNYHPGTLSELVGMGAKEFVIEDFEMVEDEGKSDVDDPSLKMPNIAKSQQIDSPSLPVELKATPSPITVSGMPKLTGPEQSSICSSQRKRQRTRAYCLDSELNGGVPTNSAHKKQKTHDGASGDALENALMQQLTTPKRELNAEEHFNLPIAKDAAYLPDSARMAVRMCNAAGVGGGNEKISEKFQDVWLQRQLDGSAHQTNMYRPQVKKVMHTVICS